MPYSNGEDAKGYAERVALGRCAGLCQSDVDAELNEVLIKHHKAKDMDWDVKHRGKGEFFNPHEYPYYPLHS